MKFETIKSLDEEKFRRLTGIKRSTFDRMIVILEEGHALKKKKGGRRNKLCVEDMLLMTLEYLREYRTYFHISQSYGISESSAYKIVRWVEETLIKRAEFSLPGRKALKSSEIVYETILIDATETPVERPKKNRNSTTQARKRSTR